MDIDCVALEACRFARLAGKGAALDALRALAVRRLAGQGRRKGAGEPSAA